MIRKYESNSAFKAHIREVLPGGYVGRPDAYQMISAAETSDIFGSWKEFCELVDEKLAMSKINKKAYEKGKAIDKLRRESMKEKDIVSKLSLKGITELRRLRAAFVEIKREVENGKRKEANAR